MDAEAEAAFTAYVEARRRALLRSAWLLTGDWHLAEDLVQAALSKTYLKWRRLDDPDSYVRRVLTTTYVTWWRRRWRGEFPTETLPDRAAADAYGGADVRGQLYDVLRELPRRQRAVVVLRYFEDLTEADTAAALGCSVGTVKSQHARALAKLRASAAIADLAPADTGAAT
ncbi:MAG TPA: SigE family RNA polymerase sigma factor [Frankiaceae bacterium]|nr:SigE family RNA polymerase sigma factor [Frankiaceae bacterium]